MEISVCSKCVKRCRRVVLNTALRLVISISLRKSMTGYGHEAGDVVLTKVARILREKIMSKGYVCRWGGEEFLIVLEDCEQEQAKQILQDVLDVLRGQSIECQGQDICVTMSVGVVQVASDEKIDDILRRADKKLYNAKAGGRDRICD